MDQIVLSQKYNYLQEQVLKVLQSARAGSGVLLQGGRNEVRLVRFRESEQQMVVKLFRKPSIAKRLWYSVKPSKAERSFKYALQLLEAGIQTPYPVAFTLEKGAVLGDSSYISEYVEPDFTFRELIHDLDILDRDDLLRAFTAFTFKMHENKVLFKDHSPGNTLIKRQAGTYEFYLVDLNRMEFKELSMEERLKNFQRLWLSKHMQKVMAQEYSRLYGSDPQITYKLLSQYIRDFQRRKISKKRFKKSLGL